MRIGERPPQEEEMLVRCLGSFGLTKQDKESMGQSRGQL